MVHLHALCRTGRILALGGADDRGAEGPPGGRSEFVMYYRTCPPHTVRDDLTASGFAVTSVPSAGLGLREDGSPRYQLVLARTASSP